MMTDLPYSQRRRTVSSPTLSLQLDGEALKPLVQSIVSEVLSQLGRASESAATDGRLAYSEAEAAAKLGLQTWQLRDERRRGRIGATRGPGNRIRYTLQDIELYLGRNRTEPTAVA